MSRRHPYHAPAEAEIARWPGVTFVRGRRGRNLCLTLTYRGVSRFCAYPDTPSDHRGALNHVSDIRSTLNLIGATRASTRQLEAA